MKMRQALGRALTPARAVAMRLEERRRDPTTDQRSRLFNLDVHVSVIADIRLGLDPSAESLLSWSLSGANGVFRKLFTAPDPVTAVNARTWTQLDDSMVREFQRRYAGLLSDCDGFISCYPPAFAQLYRDLGKPQLVVAATRYEVPYTSRNEDWERLNAFLIREVEEGRMVLAANNKGDRDYLTHHTGLTPALTPSLCDYTGMRWQPGGSRRVVFARSARLAELLAERSHNSWRTASFHFPRGYRWSDLQTVAEVFVVPYNISTMTLFELATAGIPVSVPSRELLRDWARAGEPGVLSEITFSQVTGQRPVGPDRVHDPGHPDFYDWWLDRADFYDPHLMPNVRVIDSLDRLIEEPHPWSQLPSDHQGQALESRNRGLMESRSGLLADFRNLR